MWHLHCIRMSRHEQRSMLREVGLEATGSLSPGQSMPPSNFLRDHEPQRCLKNGGLINASCSYQGAPYSIESFSEPLSDPCLLTLACFSWCKGIASSSNPDTHVPLCGVMSERQLWHTHLQYVKALGGAFKYLAGISNTYVLRGDGTKRGGGDPRTSSPSSRTRHSRCGLHAR